MVCYGSDYQREAGFIMLDYKRVDAFHACRRGWDYYKIFYFTLVGVANMR